MDALTQLKECNRFYYSVVMSKSIMYERQDNEVIFAKGIKNRKILKLFCLAVILAALAAVVVSLMVFQYSEKQTEDYIYKNAALETVQAGNDASISILDVKEQRDVRAVLFQLDRVDGKKTGLAVFTKLPLISLYRFDRLYYADQSTGIAAVVNTGLTQELILARDTNITVSTQGLGTVSNFLIMLALLILIQLLCGKMHALSMKEKVPQI